MVGGFMCRGVGGVHGLKLDWLENIQEQEAQTKYGCWSEQDGRDVWDVFRIRHYHKILSTFFSKMLVNPPVTG